MRVVAALLVLIGCVWVLQGAGIMPGSFMTGQTRWAVIGTTCVLIGLVLARASRRR